MKISFEENFKQFRCLASQCPDSCCYLWEVLVDEEAARFYQSLPGTLGDQLRSVLRQEDGETLMTLTPDRRCPMWRTDGLCRIQAELGHDALCSTCQEFPRLRHDYGSFQELGLELSCPEAARLLLSEEGHCILTREVPGGETADYDNAAMDLLLRTREEALRLCEDSGHSPGQILATLLLYSRDVDAALEDGDWTPDTPDVAAAAERAASLPLQGDIRKLFDFYRDLEILTPQWRSRLEAGPQDAPWHPATNRLIRYFLRRYWLQAISDYALSDRVKFLAASCLMIRHLGGDFTQTAQQYSKEIENDADNVDRLLDAAYSNAAFTDLNLLGLLLQ